MLAPPPFMNNSLLYISLLPMLFAAGCGGYREPANDADRAEHSESESKKAEDKADQAKDKADEAAAKAKDKADEAKDKAESQ